MDSLAFTLLSDSSKFMLHYGVVLMLATAVCFKMRTPMVTCTALGVCAAGLIASFFQDEQIATMILVTGLTVGPFGGVIVDALRSRDRRMQSVIGRRFARKYICPECGHGFSSVQRNGQCPQCECRFAGTT